MAKASELIAELGNLITSWGDREVVDLNGNDVVTFLISDDDLDHEHTQDAGDGTPESKPYRAAFRIVMEEK